MVAPGARRYRGRRALVYVARFFATAVVRAGLLERAWEFKSFSLFETSIDAKLSGQEICTILVAN
jgi:hypothetical protein